MKLLEPIVQLVGQLSFRNKLRATALVFGIPLVVLTGVMLVDINDRVNSVENERSTLLLQSPTLMLIGDLHLLAAAAQGINEGADDLNGWVESKRTHALTMVRNLQQNPPASVSTQVANASSPKWLGNWNALAETIKTTDPHAAQDLALAIRSELDQINEQNGLLSDSDADSARLLDVVTTHLPGLVDTAGHAAQIGTVVLAKQSIRGSRRNELTLHRGNFDSLVLWSLEAMRKVGLENTSVTPLLDSAGSQLNTAYAGMQEAITIKMLDTTDYAMEPSAYLTVADKAMTETHAVGSALIQATDTLLAKRLLVLQIKRNAVLIVVIAGLLLVGAGFFAAYISIMRSLNGLSDAVGTMATGDLAARVEVTTKDELGDVGERFNEMAEKLAQRTHDLNEKTHNIESMMQNLPQGILTITKDLLIHPEYSAYLKTIMETDSLAGLPALETVCAGASIGADTMAQQYATLAACLGEDRMNFDFNSHLLLTEIEKQMPDGRSKTLELIWAPICDDEDVVDKVMLVVRDVTLLRQLEAESKQQKLELEMVGQILKVNQEKFHAFIDSARQFVQQNGELIRKTKRPSPEFVTQLFRNMHTIKGNARTYGLLHLTNVSHEAEQSYDVLRNDPQATFEPAHLLSQLQSVADNLEQYAHINEHTLGRKGPGRRGSADKYLMVDRANLETLIQQLNAYDLQACHHDTLAAALESTRIELSLMGTNSVSSILEGVFDSLPSLAKELNKETPIISVVDNGVFVKNQAADFLRNVFMHLYRNSMDHGIERPEERLAQGKQATGKILLDVALTPHHLQFRLSDDGKGLALGHIRRKALEKDLITNAQDCTDETVANLIFAAGFSTASKVTEVSGRGVGMDAVQDFVKREGGSIQLVLTDHKIGAEFRSFETVINLPPTFATHSKPQHHAATASAPKASSKRIEPLEFIPAGRNIQPALA